MAAPDTVMRRAVRRYTVLTDADVEALAKWEADTIRAVAIKFLQENGVVLVGHQSVTEYAIDRASADVAVAWDLLLNKNGKRKRGRPSVDHNTLIIYAAAHWIFMGERVSVAAAAKKAAQFLGEPATKDRVEKGTKGWLRVASTLLNVGRGRDTVRQFLLKMLVDTAEELVRISGDLAAERKAEIARRKSARHASFIGAAPAVSLSPLTRETKR